MVINKIMNRKRKYFGHDKLHRGLERTVMDWRAWFREEKTRGDTYGGQRPLKTHWSWECMGQGVVVPCWDESDVLSVTFYAMITMKSLWKDAKPRTLKYVHWIKTSTKYVYENSVNFVPFGIWRNYSGTYRHNKKIVIIPRLRFVSSPTPFLRSMIFYIHEVSLLLVLIVLLPWCPPWFA